MEASERSRAVAASIAVASSLGLKVEDAVVVHDSNRIAVRLMPCGVLARVAHMGQRAGAAFEVEVARRLAEVGSPVAELEPRIEPRVYMHDGFAITLWTYHEPLPVRDIAPREYADALARLHAGMRRVDLATPHFTERVAEAQRLVANAADTPELGDADRELLSHALRGLTQAIVERGAPEQLLHGEPHAGNVLRTKHGLLFIDLETCCRGPVEFDIAHCSRSIFASDGNRWDVDAGLPDEVGEHYPGADGN